MVKNLRYKIFYEHNADEKLTVLLSIQKYHPTYSELLQKVNFRAGELKPILVELEKQDYIAIDPAKRYLCKRPLPSANDIKIYRYILRHNPKHSKMLRSLNDIDARHITAILSKLQREGLLYYDIKSEKYSIIIKNDDVIALIMDSVTTDEEIADFVQRFRDNSKQYFLNADDSSEIFLSTFFDFSMLHEHNIDLFSWLHQNGYKSLFEIYDEKRLYAHVVERGKHHPHPFWQNIDKYLCELEEEDDDVDDILSEDIEQMDENIIQDIISQLPTFKNKDDFIKALEQKIFNGYKYLLTDKTTHLSSHEDYHYGSSFEDKLLEYYYLAYPENVIIEIFTSALQKFNDYKKRYRNEDKDVLFERFFNEKILYEMGVECKRRGHDIEKLYALLLKNGRTYPGRISKRVKQCIHHISNSTIEDKNKVYAETLKLILPSAWNTEVDQ